MKIEIEGGSFNKEKVIEIAKELLVTKINRKYSNITAKVIIEKETR